MKNIGKIILLVLGVVLIALGVKSFVDLPGQNAVLEAAVYLDEAVILPENEGKLVIIHGQVEMTAPIFDETLELTLRTPKAYRYDEEYRRTENTDEKTTWDWVSRGTETLVGGARLGGFELDEKILIAFPAESDYTDFDPEEASRYSLNTSGPGQAVVHVMPRNTYYYDQASLSASSGGLLANASYSVNTEREGTRASHYRFFDPARYDAVTVAGVQQGNRLMADETLGAIVRSGVATKDALLSSNSTSLILGSAAILLLGGVCIFFGLRKKKQQPKAA